MKKEYIEHYSNSRGKQMHMIDRKGKKYIE